MDDSFRTIQTVQRSFTSLRMLLYSDIQYQNSSFIKIHWRPFLFCTQTGVPVLRSQALLHQFGVKNTNVLTGMLIYM
jgi:hypothetical protein